MVQSQASAPETSDDSRARSRNRGATEDAEHKAIFNALTDLEQKMAWHAGMWRNKRWRISLDEAHEYAEMLPEAISREHARIEAGARPPYPKLTLAYVRQLVGKAPSRRGGT